MVGLMVESFLKPGRVDLENSNDPKHYGCSVTDECISWEDTVELVKEMYDSIN